jgi:DNA invertase Pin-like site-specific DNA recombinase
MLHADASKLRRPRGPLARTSARRCAQQQKNTKANLMQNLQVMNSFCSIEIPDIFLSDNHFQKVAKFMTTYGYARVSTNGQDLAGQEAELRAAGCAKVYREKASGAKTDRTELAKLIRRLEPGDVLAVTRLDRLARSTRDLLNIIATIAERKAGFRSLKDIWADTTTPHGRLMLTVLGGLAEFERELIRARTGDGRQRARGRGVRFGRPAALTPHQRHEALQRLANGEVQADVARSYDVSQATISRLQA